MRRQIRQSFRHTRRVVFACLFVMIFTFPVFSHPGDARIEGTVTDATSSEPLATVSVQIDGSRQGTTTDIDGRFSLPHLHDGRIRLIISHLGYEPESRVLTVSPDESVSLSISLNPTSFEMAPVVVTGTLTPRYVPEAPVRTEVITGRDLEMRSASNLYESLENSPGVRVEEQCQSCNFTMVRMNGLGGDHTQVMLDGLPVYSGLTGVYGLQQVAASEIERIEVVRGAGSALYGSNAIAGAINVVTERAVSDQIEAGVEVGSFGTRQLDASASMVRGDVALNLTAQINEEDAIDQTQDGYSRDEVVGEDGITDRVESNLRNVGAGVFVDDVVVDGDEVSLRLHYLSETRIGGELSNDLYRNPYSPGTEHISTTRYSGTLGYLVPLSPRSELNLRVAAVQHDRNATNDTYLNDYADTHNGEFPDVDRMRPYLAEEQMIVVDGNVSYRFNDHALMFGTRISHDELSESGRYVIVDPDDPHYAMDYTSSAEKQAWDFGLFAQDEWHLSENWEAVLGLRYDLHQSEDEFAAVEFGEVFDAVEYDETSLNPRLALKWSPSGWWTYRASVGTGFRVPYGFSEDLHLCSGSPRLWKGPSLQPESSRSLSLSADYSRSGLGISVNAYATRLIDAIGIVDAGPAATARGYHYEYRNIDDATVYGADLSVQLPIRRAWRLTPSVSYFHGEYDSVRKDWVGTEYEADSQYISRFPGISGSVRLDYANGPWDGLLEAQVTGPMYIDYAADGDVGNQGSKIHETETFVIVNAQISYELLQQYRLYLGVRNLNDYIQTEKHTDDAAFMYGPVYGRQVYGGLRVTL